MLIFTQHVAKSEDVCTQIVSLITYIRNIYWEQPSQVSETSVIPLNICHLICKFSQKHTLMLPYNQKFMSETLKALEFSEWQCESLIFVLHDKPLPVTLEPMQARWRFLAPTECGALVAGESHNGKIGIWTPHLSIRMEINLIIMVIDLSITPMHIKQAFMGALSNGVQGASWSMNSAGCWKVESLERLWMSSPSVVLSYASSIWLVVK